MRRLIAMALTLGMLASCAGGKPKVEPAPAPAETQPSQFTLPEVTKAAETRPAPKLDAVLTEKDKDEQYIILNFENTDIRTIISTFAELLEMNYILTPGISGGVTIQSYKRFPVKNLFAIFQSILEVNGLTAVKDGDFYHIMPIDNARVAPMDIEKGAEIEYRLDGAFVTQLIPLQNVKAGDVANNILRNLLPRGVNLIVYEPSNMLIITARPNTLSKLMKIIDALDVTEDESNAVRTFVYYVENGEAKKLQDILKSVYLNQPSNAPKSSTPAPATPAPKIIRPGTAAPAPAAASEGELPADLGDVTITAYEDINALIIKASPRGYLTLLEVLKKVDVPPRQVLIDVMIAEVSLTDKLQFGLEWLLKSGSGDIAGFKSGGITAPPGTLPANPDKFFSVAATGTASGDTFSALFSALSSYTEVNVLATPSILAMDNKEAEIKIGNEVPNVTGKTSDGTNTSTTVQYKTVGTILTVTPHITEKGNVSMKISVESSDLGEKLTLGVNETYYAYTTRKAATTAVIDDKQTLFLGGLIYDKKTQSSSGIPWLSKIPLIGWIFGSQSYDTSKAELLLMVTPHVVRDSEEARELTSQYQARVKIIKDNLSIKEKKPDKKKKDEAEPKETEKTAEKATEAPKPTSPAPLTAVVPAAPAKPAQPAPAQTPAPAEKPVPSILAPATAPAPAKPAQVAPAQPAPAATAPAPAKPAQAAPTQPAPAATAPAPVKPAQVAPAQPAPAATAPAPAKPAQVVPTQPVKPAVPAPQPPPSPVSPEIAPRPVD